MHTLAIDIETFSSVDIKKCGMYKYLESPDFEIMLFAYSFDNEPVQVVDLTDLEELPMKVKNALIYDNVKKTAWNAQFERRCIEKYFMMHLPVNQWECTMLKASMLGLPLALDAAGKALQLDNGKMAEGKGLIRYFCVPCKPTKANDQRTRNYPMHAPDKWQRFKEYCAQDVVTERTIGNKIAFFEVPEMEKQLYKLDQQINDRGVMIDPVLVNNAIRMDIDHRERLTKEAVQLTGLDNPNSVAQLKEWISKEMDEEVGSLNKKDIPAILAKTDNAIVQKVLELRQEMSKTSVKKYAAMHNAACSDNRVRGLLQMYGANRTGRWAGRLVQVQNLPKNEMPDLDLARQVVRSGDLECLELMYASVSDVLKQLIRTAFIAPDGHRLIAADFSAIEARVIAWLAGEKWRLDVFNTHGKIYEASASQMFKVPIESIGKGSPLRQKGKVSELALGYQGAVNALLKMGALEMGLKEEELPALVAMWRQANPMIVKFWNTCQEAALEAVESRAVVSIQHGIKFLMEKGILFIQLPSGRRLSYLRPKLKQGQYGPALTYEGMDQTTKKWGVQDTYGGKLVENIVQATARDVLADAMLRLNKSLYTIVMHVHDEAVMDMPTRLGSVEEVNEIMGQPIAWAKGLPLKAESYETMFYKKIKMETTLTPEEQQFIIENRLLMCSRDLAAKLNCSKTKVLRFLKDKNLQPPADIINQFRRKAATGKTILTPAQDKIIKRDYLKVPIKKLAQKFGVSQTAVRSRLKYFGLVIPKEIAEQRKKANQIQPGTVSHNKGKKMPKHVYKRCKATMFKKGHLPHNSIGYKDGDLSFRADKSGIVYVYIRLSLGKWYPLHQYCWEVANGKVPKGHCLWFIDGDSMNCTLPNLQMITRKELMAKNSYSVRLTDSFVAQALSRKKGGVGLFDRELKQIILQNKPLIELKRKQLLLNRTINERKETKQSA